MNTIAYGNSRIGEAGRWLSRNLFHTIFLAIFLSGLIGGWEASAEEPAVVAIRPLQEYRTDSGDKLRITVFGHDDLSGEFQVDGSGYIALPLIGGVEAGNKSAHELELAIVNKLSPDFLKNPQVSVEVLTYRPFYILGEVNNPGSYAYVNGMTVITAIAVSGGYTYRGRENKVSIIRANDPERKKHPANHDTVVFPGDVIEVPERFF